MKQKLYIDFDSTLFDSDKYDSILLKICNKYGITNDRLDEIKRILFSRNTDFDIDILISYLIEKENVDKKILEDIKNLKNHSFLYEDTLLFLECIQDKYNPILLTCGGENNQKDKIKASGIDHFFSEIIITPEDKSKLDNVDYKNSIFIDNNPQEVIRFIKAGAKKVIRIRRDTDKYSKIDLNISNVEEYTSLYDVLIGLEIEQDEYLLIKTKSNKGDENE